MHSLAGVEPATGAHLLWMHRLPDPSLTLALRPPSCRGAFDPRTQYRLPGFRAILVPNGLTAIFAQKPKFRISAPPENRRAFGFLLQNSGEAGLTRYLHSPIIKDVVAALQLLCDSLPQPDEAIGLAALPARLGMEWMQHMRTGGCPAQR